jgi:Fic-DOC domain mobile mystery protein B
MLGYKPRPGETPINDWSGLIPKGLTLYKEVADLEAANIQKPTIKYLAAAPSPHLAPFDYTWVLRLHGEMYCDVWAWAGKLRTENLNLGVDWQQIEMRLFELLKDLAYWRNKGVPIQEQAVLLHHKSVFIHPFSNGNGRWSRMLESILLLQNGVTPPSWPEDTIENGDSIIRKDYLAALRAADDGNYRPLTELQNMFIPKKN